MADDVMAVKVCGHLCHGEKLAASLNKLTNFDTGGVTFGPWNYAESDPDLSAG